MRCTPLHAGTTAGATVGPLALTIAGASALLTGYIVKSDIFKERYPSVNSYTGLFLRHVIQYEVTY